MYVSRCDIKLVAAFVEGYAMALEAVGAQEPVWWSFRCWLEGSYGISHPGWHWSDILLFSTGSHQGAIWAIEELFSKFLANGPLADPLEWAAQRVLEKRGCSVYAPDDYNSEAFRFLAPTEISVSHGTYVQLSYSEHPKYGLN
jgi:hypothetical protein